MHIKDNPDTYKQDTEAKVKMGALPMQLFIEWNKILTGPLGLEFAKSPQAFLRKYFNYSLEEDKQ